MRCLYCYEELAENQVDYHKKCSKKIFGTETAPELDLSLTEIENYAVDELKRSISVTGVQPKLSIDLVREKKGPGRLTIVGLWGKYILKPPFTTYPEMPEIEALTMKIAQESGIKVAEHSLIKMKSGELAYISKRFDRTADDKLHMEDFAQILGVLTERKYSGSVEQVGKHILKYSSFPGNDLIRLFDLALFCFLTGNSDMHLKNFSLLRDEYDDIQLSPAYDLLSTKLLLPEDKEEFAITINGRKANLRKGDFNKLAKYLKLNNKILESIYSKYASILTIGEPLITKSFLSQGMKKKYVTLIKNRLNQIEL